MTVFEKLRERGFKTVPEDFYAHIDEWKSWYEGNVRDFHSYKVYNGFDHVNCHRYTLGMAKKVCEDWANLLMNEKVAITLENDAAQAFFDDVCTSNNFEVRINEMQEYKSAFGTVAYIPRVVGGTYNQETGVVTGDADGIAIDYCTADSIFPLSWEDGTITECAFASEKTVAQQGATTGEQKYLYLQIHHKNESGIYIIENVLYANREGSLTEVDPGTVSGFEGTPTVVYTGSDEPQFVIDRPNIANNIDKSVPLGISVYANAIDQLKGVDVAYDSYVNEFILGKKRIMVKPEATKGVNNEPYFDSRDTVFYVLPEDSSSGSVIQPIDMSLRTSEHNAGIQDMLNLLSSKCGFGANHYRFDQGSVATATQVVSENSEMFRTIKKHEIILEDALKKLVRVVLRLGNQYMGAKLDEDVEISIDFDDSVVEDKQVDFARTLQLLSAGLMKPEEARSILMNEDIETARKALPTMEDLTTEPQNELE